MRRRICAISARRRRVTSSTKARPAGGQRYAHSAAVRADPPPLHKLLAHEAVAHPRGRRTIHPQCRSPDRPDAAGRGPPVPRARGTAAASHPPPDPPANARRPPQAHGWRPAPRRQDHRDRAGRSRTLPGRSHSMHSAIIALCSDSAVGFPTGDGSALKSTALGLAGYGVRSLTTRAAGRISEIRVTFALA